LFKGKKFTKYLIELGYSQERISAALETVRAAYTYFEIMEKKFEECQVEDFRIYVSKLMEEGENTEEVLVDLGRYIYFSDMKEVWIYFASILGGRNILPSISKRLAEIAGEKVREKVFSKVEAPPLGSPPSAYCDATSSLMRQLEKGLNPKVYRRVLSGNHHNIPMGNFEKHKKWLVETGSINSWLSKMHLEAFEELEQYLKEEKVWYEQVITPEVVEYVRDNQEILAGVRRENWIYNTKFPYNPQEYILETQPLMKRYYMCHCPMARESILKGEPEIPMDWCYCSAGYGKLRSDVAFDTETEVEVLESVFNGSDKCRFRIKIPEDVFKKYVNVNVCTPA
jgi:hypothetical protein